MHKREKGLSHQLLQLWVKLGANSDFNFLIVYQNFWWTLIFQKEIYLPGNQIFGKSFVGAYWTQLFYIIFCSVGVAEWLRAHAE